MMAALALASCMNTQRDRPNYANASDFTARQPPPDAPQVFTPQSVTSVGGTAVVSPGMSRLGDTKWTLTELNGGPVRASTTLSFQPDGIFRGIAPCNRYGGQFREAGDRLTVLNIGSTRRACSELSEEGRYFTVLRHSAAFRVSSDGERLALLDADAVVVARFARSR